MAITVQIKVDSAKMRVYFSGDVSLISNYLKGKGYACVAKTLAAAAANINQAKAELLELKKPTSFFSSMMNSLAMVSVHGAPMVINHFNRLARTRQQQLTMLAQQKVMGYSAPEYNLVWDEGSSFVVLEYRFPIKKHFNDQQLAHALARLAKPMHLSISDKETKSNMSVIELKEREYVTILPQTETTADAAITVALEFEKMAYQILKQAHPQVEKLPSRVDVVYDSISPATHLKTVGVFASTPSNSTAHDSSTFTKTYSTNSSINSTNMP